MLTGLISGLILLFETVRSYMPLVLFCKDLQKQLVVSKILKKRPQKRDEWIKLKEDWANN